jgi:hypothetical protein
MEQAILWAVIVLISVGANIAVRSRGVSWAAFWLKTLCGVEFVITSIAGLVYLQTEYGDRVGDYAVMAALFVAGAVAGFVGDVVLSLKDLTPRLRTGLFVSGFAAFGVGHVLYIVGIVLAWHIKAHWIGLAIACSVLLSLSFVKAAKLLGLRFGRFTMIVRVYGALLISLSAIGIAALAGHNPLWTEPGVAAQPVVVAVAGVSFLISDIVLGYTYFGKNRESPLGHALCYVFYYAAQFGLALSLFVL